MCTYPRRLRSGWCRPAQISAYTCIACCGATPGKKILRLLRLLRFRWAYSSSQATEKTERPVKQAPPTDIKYRAKRAHSFGIRQQLDSVTPHPGSFSRRALRRQIVEVGAICLSRASTDTCGARQATAVPTATLLRRRLKDRSDRASRGHLKNVEGRHAVLTVTHAWQAFGFFRLWVRRSAGWSPLRSAEDYRAARPAVSRIRKTRTPAAARS